jgi:hypothetical protein
LADLVVDSGKGPLGTVVAHVLDALALKPVGTSS